MEISQDVVGDGENAQREVLAGDLFLVGEDRQELAGLVWVNALKGAEGTKRATRSLRR